MKDKILYGVICFLVIVVFIEGVQMYFLKIKINAVLQEQIDEFELLKEENLKKTDSIEFLKKNKETVIAEKEHSFYGNVAKAEKNNIYYEDIKKSISNTDAADSLARQLTRRYSK